MRLSIAREKLQEGLSAVASAVPGKTTLPVLGNLLLETTERGLKLSATDLDVAVSTEVAADVETAGALTLPARKITEIARELPAPSVKISSSDQRAVIECGRSKFKLLGMAKDEFPAFPAVAYDRNLRVKSGDLQRLISHTVFAVSTEESRPILNGVLWEIHPSQLLMVATNGHRLARMQVGGQYGSDDVSVIIPPRALEQVRRLFPADEELEIGMSENHISFRSPLTTVISRVIEGPYPNYEQVIPLDNDKTAVIDRAALTSALRRMAIVASDQTHRVRLSFNAALVKFSVQTPDVGEAQDELPVHFSGDPLEIGFNGNYLLEILRYMPTDDVRLTLKGPERAATISPEGWDGGADYLCLLMPLRLVD
ncbi:MAG: Beta sliding clamp [Gemmatimonadaceae bacterium]|nr:Beta sliding clamp [Gemmatimonadaceae bacterium]